MEKSNFAKMSDMLHKSLNDLKYATIKSIRDVIRTFGDEYEKRYELVMSYKGHTIKSNDVVYGGTLVYDEYSDTITIEQIIDDGINVDVDMKELDVELMLAVYDKLLVTYDV